MSNIRITWVALFAVIVLQTSCAKIDEVSPDNTGTDTTATAGGTAQKDAILKLYNEEYVPSILTEIGWSGNVSNCNAGITPTNTQNKVLQRLNFYRKLVGLPGNVVLNAEKSNKCQQAALMSRANNSLSHSPPTTWSCYTADGREASGKSNLSLGSAGSRAVDAYIRDAGSGNYFVGHRRWILYPKLQEVGTGDTDRSNALWVIGDIGPVPLNMPDFVAYPPKGFMPQDLVYPRWSFSIPSADFSNAKVTMTDASGNTVNLTQEKLNNGGFGDRTMVWVPENINITSADDVTYKVNITGVKLVSGETKDFSYEVTIFKAK
ncbi:CAP domain-containing protein [uncultured Microscilla sp.]|uniref:CAP domain-containing protein n=1 Tax=uncultured Microscilla sp. TaxID=432653 RepID=UPI00261D79E4|nr:CAP domain-containing protein [uncultured Microscilla sp.]